MALQALKILLVFFFAAVQAEFDPLLADDCTGEECQIELRQLRGIRGAKDVAGEEPTDAIPAEDEDVAGEEPTDAIPAEDEAAPAATPATVAPADSGENAPVAEAKTTCTSLENHGSFSSAKVGIGTPPQHFELVADTGSDNVIVQSCMCKEQRYCPQDFGKCFKGTGRSSTFQIEMVKNEEGKEGLIPFVMSFGSGDILVVKSSDKVEVGDAKAFMNQSLLLMVNQALKIRGQFEGILGLGRPHRGENASKMVPGFMKLAGIERFSMCFNDQGPGVLGFNEPVQKDALQSVGSVHWGLEFQGISVGESTKPLSFCQEKKRGMQSACGLIPDSGTTLITGPKDYIEKLYEGICLQWSRCLEMHQALQTQIQKGRSNLAQRSKVVRRMRAMLQAGSKDIIDVYDDDELGAGPEYYDGDDYGYDYADGEAPDSPMYGDGEYGPEYDEGPDDLEAPYEGPGPEEPPAETDPSFDGDLRIGGDDIIEPEGVAAEEAEEEEAEEEEAEEAEEAEGSMEPEAEDAPEEESGVVVEMPDNAGVAESEAKAAGPDTAQPGLPDISLASTFVLLMKHCYTWLGNSTNLDTEMPNLTFNVVGTAGGKEALKLDPNSYVFLTTVPIVHKEVEYFLGYLPVEIVTVRNQQVCLPAFSAMNYTTEKNGPIWIMGTPLFYSYKVQYDREPEPPTISFGKGCGTCREGTRVPPSAKSTRLFQQSGGLGRLRTLKSPPVVRKVDPEMGL